MRCDVADHKRLQAENAALREENAILRQDVVELVAAVDASQRREMDLAVLRAREQAEKERRRRKQRPGPEMFNEGRST